MSVSRSPRLTEIRRREDEADTRRTAIIIAVISGAAIIGNFVFFLHMVKP